MIGIKGVDYQISCMLRKTSDGIVLRSCPFQHSNGHGDRSCMLLLMIASDNPDKEVEWEVKDSIKAIFGDTPSEKYDYKKISEWKFPHCPLCEIEEVGEQK